VRIALGCDHNGLELKNTMIGLLQELGHECQDFGCYDTDSVDYPDVAREVAEAVAESRFDHGVLICGTGIGMSISANKVHGVRAGLCHDVFSARRARQHNDVNVLCLGSYVIGKGLALEVVKAYVEAHFEGERHARRVEKIAAMESNAALEKPKASYSR
jgi:ribose 5-phosphate isomerase B